MMHPWQAAKEALAAGSAGDVTVGEAIFFFLEKKREEPKICKGKPISNKKDSQQVTEKNHTMRSKNKRKKYALKNRMI